MNFSLIVLLMNYLLGEVNKNNVTDSYLPKR